MAASTKMLGAGTLLALTLTSSIGAMAAESLKLDTSALPTIGKVDERFVSYNIESASVTGADFWKPYASMADSPKSSSPDAVAGHSRDLYEYRPPIDLGNHRLRALAKALGPAYLRVSGSWANAAYFQDNDRPRMKEPPEGFKSVMTRKQWKGVIDFARAADARIVTSFANTPAVRDSAGVWTPAQARLLIEYTHKIGGSIYAAELYNEPNLPGFGGIPKDFDARTFARDEAAFRAFLDKMAPDIKVAGPGNAITANMQLPGGISAEDLMATEPRPHFDVISYHFYPAVSQRCAPPQTPVGADPDQTLSEAWLARTDKSIRRFRELRDRYAPGAPIWNTETAGAACGGTPWDSQFLDTFRFVDQMARLAKQGADVIFHQTLTGSDYGLLDESTFRPKPNYWAALLWRRLVGPVVLDAGPIRPGLHLYAQCMRNNPGGVAVVAINLKKSAASLDLGSSVEVYALTAPKLRSDTVLLNGKPLALRHDDRIPPFKPKRAKTGKVTVKPRSINFVMVPGAQNPACR